MIDTAVILAAGNGTRLRGVSGELPKPLVPVAGVPLLVRIMRAAQEAGVRRFVVVTGYQADRLHDAIDGHPAISADVDWVHNPDYKTRPNGVSALAAQGKIDGPFALLMADHVFDVDVLKRLLRTDIGPRECLLATDRKISQVYDLDDATKVVEADGRVLQIGKDLPVYNAIDTGMFLCTPVLFEALDDAVENGSGGLSDGIAWLSERGSMRTWDVGDGQWQDVDTPEMRREAERRLGQTLRRPADGPIAKVLNRRISIPISLLLSRTGITPNQISYFGLALGMLAGLAMASTTYLYIAIGGALLQLMSILDGCDGELARLTFRETNSGDWMGRAFDHLSLAAFFAGLLVGQFRCDPTSLTLCMSGIAVVASLAGLVLMFQRLRTTGGRHGADFDIPDPERIGGVNGAMFRLYGLFRLLLRRDVFIFTFFLLAVAGQPGAVFGLWLTGSVASALALAHVAAARGTEPARATVTSE